MVDAAMQLALLERPSAGMAKDAVRPAFSVASARR
jgi:hypothetical protein